MISRFAVTVASVTAIIAQIADALSQSSRRTFLTKAIGAASSLAFISNHDIGCACAICAGAEENSTDGVHEDIVKHNQVQGNYIVMNGHDSRCSCSTCDPNTFLPPPVSMDHIPSDANKQ